MKKLYIVLSIALIVGLGCNSYKKAQKNIYQGKFDTALKGMVKKYQRSNVSQKDINRWGKLFIDAYIKANKRDADNIRFFTKKPESIRKYAAMLNTYKSLQRRNELVRPIMPFTYKNQEINLGQENYYTQIAQMETKLANQYYQEAENQMATFDKYDARVAYDYYSRAKKYNPLLEDIDEKMKLAYHRGLSHTLVQVNNDAFVIMPGFLERDMTNFNSYGVQSFWNILHTTQDRDASEYDYVLELNFTQIGVRPYRESINRYTVTKEIDLKIKDSSSRKKGKTIECEVTEIRQYKEAAINSEIILMDNRGRRVHRESPIVSNHIFDYTWVKLRGNRNALERNFMRRVNLQPTRVPTDELMLIGCAEELKGRFKGFIHQRVANL